MVVWGGGGEGGRQNKLLLLMFSLRRWNVLRTPSLDQQRRVGEGLDLVRLVHRAEPLSAITETSS